MVLGVISKRYVCITNDTETDVLMDNDSQYTINDVFTNYKLEYNVINCITDEIEKKVKEYNGVVTKIGYMSYIEEDVKGELHLNTFTIDKDIYKIGDTVELKRNPECTKKGHNPRYIPVNMDVK